MNYTEELKRIRQTKEGRKYRRSMGAINARLSKELAERNRGRPKCFINQTSKAVLGKERLERITERIMERHPSIKLTPDELRLPKIDMHPGLEPSRVSDIAFSFARNLQSDGDFDLYGQPVQFHGL